ncbi:hypothetical protein ES703_87267 [subsurface metagenome]
MGQDQFFKNVQGAGGTLNGFTFEDGTSYFEVVPKNALEMVLWMESDRMGFLLGKVTQEAFANQQDVVQNEKRQRVDNLPYGHTSYVIDKLLFPEDHPYNWQVIGSLEDIRNATLEDVKEFFKTWYGPNNATLVIAGDYDREQTMAWVEKYYGEIKPAPPVDDPKSWHVQLEETRRAFHEDNFAKSPELNMVYPTVQEGHPDAYALSLLAQLLTDGKKAPFYKVIVEERKLAPSVSGYQRSMEITGTFRFRVRTFPSVNLTELEQAIFESFERFETDGFTDRDMARVKAQFERNFYNAISSILGKVLQLASYNEYFGSPDYIVKDIQNYLDVTREDVMRVYNTYLKDKPYVLTSFVPKGQMELVAKGSERFPIVEDIIISKKAEEEPEAAVSAEMVIEKTPSSFDRSVMPPFGPDPLLTLPTVWRHELANGIRVFGIQHDELPLVQFSLVLKGGLLLDSPDKVGVANLMTDVMMEGTKNRTPVELEEAIEELGSSISMFTGRESITIRANTLTRNFGATYALLEEILLESVGGITIDDLKAYYARTFSPTVAYVSIVGNISQRDAVKTFNSLAEKWAAKEVTFPELPPTPTIDKSTLYFVDVPGAKQSQLRVGYLGLPYTNPDYYPATVMNYKLGGAFNSILNMILREEKGYTYGARSRFSGGHYPGTFVVSTAVHSAATLESVAIVKDEITKYTQGIAPEDLQFTKDALIKSNARRFETLGALMGTLNEMAHYDLPDDYIKDHERIIQEMTLARHQQLAQKYLPADRMVYLVVGDAQTQLELLKKLGLGDPILLEND